MDPIIQLAYISKETHTLPKEAVKKILEESVNNNSSKHITGMLIFYNGTFLQVLEGHKKLVTDLYDNLKKDARHKNLLLLYTNPIKSPDFSSWSMGFVDAEEIIKSGDKDFYNYFEKNLNFEKEKDFVAQDVKLLINKFKNGAWRNYIK
jgi:hypothetical protein